MTTDKLTRDLRRIEKEIDDHYKSNPLMNLPFATAAWYFLAFAEEVVLKEGRNRGSSAQTYAIIADNLVNALKNPIGWLYCTCEQGGPVPRVYNGAFYQASWDFFQLGQEYNSFVWAYTFFSQDWIQLNLNGTRIQPSEILSEDVRYEAYNRLIKPHKLHTIASSVNSDNLPTEEFAHTIRIQGERFSYKLNPRIVSNAITTRKPILDEIFSLPSDWQFSHYTLGDFRKVFEVISALAFIHIMARSIAISQGCPALGYADSIYLPTCENLLRRIVMYSGISETIVRSILDDLIYGNRDISDPDPALQPLIKLNSDVYAVMPHLWLFSSAERNLTVLFNRLPSEKEIYSKLVSKKESLMRERFTTRLCAEGFRFISGNVSGLPDIDLAIIRDSEQTCLLLELKWFIDPAEPREIIEKSEEIEKGICQLVQLKRAFANNHDALLKKLKIDSCYRLDGTVVSENWIGHAKAQSTEIPVIRAEHLIEKLKTTVRLESAMDWLTDRKYLPTEGEHFNVHKTTSTVGHWSVEWYEIEPLIGDPFFPL